MVNSKGQYINMADEIVKREGSSSTEQNITGLRANSGSLLLNSTEGLQSWVAGQLGYDPNTLTFVADSGVIGVRNNLGQELWYIVYNDSGAQIDNGKLVYASGVDATNKVFTVELADNTALETSSAIVGCATHNIGIGELGLVTYFGQVNNKDTSLLTIPGQLYLGTNGDFTNTKPLYPAKRVLVGRATEIDAVTGSIWMKVDKSDRKVLTFPYSFSSQGVAAGIRYVAGYYSAPATAKTFTNADRTQLYGDAGRAELAHAFIVAGSAGNVVGGVVGLRVNGATYDEATGTVNASDSEILTADITTLTTNKYLETVKFFNGEITFELYTVSGTPTVADLQVNYGIAKYADGGNRDFTLDYIEIVGLAGANDTTFNVKLMHHSANGWVFSAGAFVPGDGLIAEMAEMTPNDNLTNTKHFTWKRTNLDFFVNGSGSEGIVVQITTGLNNSVTYSNTLVVAYSEELE